ncbi:hypothetical protein CEP53_004571 [Fusarium sp. AF-6]|nr:hypothetical protein CEP53_004571 [Fusarium sp. AF-6]
MAGLSKLPSVTWTRIASSVRLYRSSQAVSVVGEKMYIFGGELVPRQPVDNKIDVVKVGGQLEYGVQTLPPQQGSPTPRVGSPSTAINGDIYLFSGRGGLEMKPIEENGGLWRYEVSKAQWTLLQPSDASAPFPAGRSYHCITSDGVSKVYVHSGCPQEGRLHDLWVFDIVESAWRELPQAPGPARGGASITFADGKLYRMNGFDGKKEQGGSLDVFNIEASTWKTIYYKADGIRGPEPRSVSTLLPVTVQGKPFLVTVFGEGNPSPLGHAGAGNMFSDGWAYEIEQNLWHKLDTAPEGPAPRGWFDADLARDEAGKETIVVHGGLGEDNQRLGDVWSLRFSE